MSDIGEIKARSPLQELVQESGYPLERQDERYWRAQADPGLVVDVQAQRYYWGDESGDVLGWLKQRHGWNFAQAVNFLRHRLALPEGLRPRREPVEAAPAEAVQAGAAGGGAASAISAPRPWLDANGQALDPWAIADKRVRSALYFLADYGDLGEIFARGFFAAVAAQGLVPAHFLALTGHLEGEACSWCFKGFEGWQEGSAYLAFEGFGSGYELVIDQGHGQAGIYCAECVGQFKRWQQGFELLIPYLAERWQVERAERAACPQPADPEDPED